LFNCIWIDAEIVSFSITKDHLTACLSDGLAC
jgi:hypothetical protein